MSVVERVRSRGLQLLGCAKEMAGRTTGNRRREMAGRTDRAVGAIRETATEVRDWAATAARDARRRFRSDRPVS